MIFLRLCRVGLVNRPGSLYGSRSMGLCLLDTSFTYELWCGCDLSLILDDF